jgi:hypothetical protein
MSTTNWADLVQAAGDSAGSYDPLPNGDYDLQVVEASATTASTGKKMFKTKSEVQTGAYAKRLVWDNLVISPDNPKAMGAVLSKFNALGVSRDFLMTNPTDAQIEQALSGVHFRATLGQRTYQGNVSNEITKYHSRGAAGAPAAVSAPAAAPAPAPAPAAAPAPVYAAAPAVAVQAPGAPF